MAAYVELYMDQGTTFNNIINLTDDVTNLALNISGYVVRSQMRRSYYSANATANITCTISNAANGEITMSMTAANTSNIKAGRYLFDLETIAPGDVVTRVLEGIITVTPEVTR
jgi:DNA-directed RNA polymerase alpha subunit